MTFQPWTDEDVAGHAGKLKAIAVSLWSHTTQEQHDTLNSAAGAIKKLIAECDALRGIVARQELRIAELTGEDTDNA